MNGVRAIGTNDAAGFTFMSELVSVGLAGCDTVALGLSPLAASILHPI